jgi:hypothetical protein
MNIKVRFIDWDKTLSVSRFWGHWTDTEPEYYSLIQTELFGSNAKWAQGWMRGKLSAEQITEQLSDAVGIEKYVLSTLYRLE